jgi:LmbE family N-acetylglucosaminyl deacetylase
MAAHGGPFDITLDFGYRIADGDPDVQVRLTMSWEHVLAMVKALQKMVDTYEKQTGPLPDLERLREET